MDNRYCELSQIDYKFMDIGFLQWIMGTKYLERPFAYEFYHQLRSLVEEDKIDFGGPIIQAEVDKDYQHIFQNGKIPDFIIHDPNSSNNLVVIEFKLAKRDTKDIKVDLEKLELFKKILNYDYAVEVLVGSRAELNDARQRLQQVIQSLTEQIIVVEFDTDSWKANST